MATKYIVPMTPPPVSTYEFKDGKRTLEAWEAVHANNEDALKATGRPLRELTYAEWQELVDERFGLEDFLKDRKWNSKLQLSRLSF